VNAIATAFAALPFGFALIRLVQTGTDARYVVVALASTCGAVLGMLLTRPVTSARFLRVAVVVFISATLVAIIAALLLGTRLGPGIFVVAAAFGFCFAAASAMHARTRG
jgi:uncharacterized membrane protein YbjE (DUF340 family)